MSATFGSDRNQDMMPMPRQQSSLLDPRVRIQQQREPGEIVETTRRSRHRHRSHKRKRSATPAAPARQTPEPEPPAPPEYPPDSDMSDVDDNRKHSRDRDSYRDNYREKYHENDEETDRRYDDSRKRARRRYRPDSPTDSVSSDFEILANKQKLKDEVPNQTTPLQRLGDTVIPPRKHADDDYDDYDLDNSRYDDGGGFDDDLGFDDRGDEFESGGDEIGDEFDEPMRRRPGAGGSSGTPQYTYEETLQKKAAIMVDLDRRAAAGDRIEYNDKMTLEQLTLLKNKCIHKSRGQHTIKLLRQGVTIYASVLEWLAKRFPQLNMDLTDFGKDIFSRKNDFDDLLYEIHDMYAESLKVNPVIMLMLTITAQAAMYSAARSIVKNIQSSMHFGAPSVVPPPPVIPPMPTERLREDGSGLADIDINGPVEGFDTKDLLELCREQMEKEKEKQQNTEQKTESAPSITVDIPTNNEGVQIIRGGAKKGASAGANKRKKTAAAAPNDSTAVENTDATRLWDPEIDNAL